MLVAAALLCLSACSGSIIQPKAEEIDINGDWYRSPAVSDAQGNYEPDELGFVVRNGKTGFIDETGKEVIPCRYDNHIVFSKRGYASVYNGGKCGVINTSGEEVIPLEYDWIEDIPGETDYAVASKDGKCGYINLSGGEGIPFCFDEADYFSSDGYAAVSVNSKWGVINTKGEITVPIMYAEIETTDKGYSVVTNGGKKGLVDSSGIEILPAKYDMIDAIPAGDTVVFAVYKGSESYLYSDKGEVLAEFGKTALEYDSELKTGGIIGTNSAGIKAAMQGTIDEDHPPVYRLYDKTGKSISDAEYSYFTDYGSVAYVETEEGCGLITSQGEEILPCAYDYMTEISADDSEPWLAYYRLYEGWTVYDTSGKRVTSLRKVLEDAPEDSDFYLIGDDRIVIGLTDGYDGPLAGDMKDFTGRKINKGSIKVLYGMNNGNTVITRDNENEKNGLMDTDGNILVPAQYSSIDYTESSYGPFYLARTQEESGRVTYFNRKGEQVTETDEYDDPMSVEGLIGTD